MYEAKHENLPMYNYPIHRAFRKYGKENFKFEIIEETDELDAREKYWIEFFNSIEEGYNIVNGGGKGPSLPGELNPRARLTNQEVYEIRTRLLNKEMPSSVYKDFQDKISESAFYKIWRGETWKEILPEAIEYTKTSEYIHNIRSFARQQ